MVQPDEVTQLLVAASSGDRRAFQRLIPLVYDELRGIAHRRMAGERSDHSLDTGALVHEAYLKLVDLDRIQWRDRAQFFAIAARAMRQILIDHALGKRAQKRGGGRRRIALDRALVVADESYEELLDLNQALERLSRLDERQAQVVECRFFAGMSIEETAEALNVSMATVKRDWTEARAWLNRELEV